MNVWGYILYKVLGWKNVVDLPRPNKCVICIAPHTSNWDFIISILYEKSTGGKAHFLMKKEWFFWPLGILFRSLGGIAVERGRKRSARRAPSSSEKGTAHVSGLTLSLTQRMMEANCFQIAITPEGTRSIRREWHTGFYHIARITQTPILLFVIDYKNKCILCQKEIIPSNNMEADLALIKDYYRHYAYAAKYPAKFSV